MIKLYIFFESARPEVYGKKKFSQIKIFEIYVNNMKTLKVNNFLNIIYIDQNI